MAALLELDDIEFAYGTVQVLFGVSLYADEGEMLALLGTNGAGKSTLLRIVSGLAKPAHGTVTVDNTDVTGHGVVDMVERGVTMVPGGKAVFGDLTVADNLEIAGYPLRRETGELARRRVAVLETFPQLTQKLTARAGTLSGGQQQQLALAKALLVRPKLLLIDELSLGLAPVVIESLLDAVRAANNDGATVVLVEQSLNIAASLCTRAVFLEKGAVRFEGKTSELTANDDVARAVFLGAR